MNENEMGNGRIFFQDEIVSIGCKEIPRSHVAPITPFHHMPSMCSIINIGLEPSNNKSSSDSPTVNLIFQPLTDIQTKSDENEESIA
jgi:hypothetical protein